jgi:hypothetical protein
LVTQQSHELLFKIRILISLKKNFIKFKFLPTFFSEAPSRLRSPSLGSISSLAFLIFIIKIRIKSAVACAGGLLLDLLPRFSYFYYKKSEEDPLGLQLASAGRSSLDPKGDCFSFAPPFLSTKKR